MFAISPKLGEFLIKTTKAKDLNVAFYKIFSEYLVLKLIELNETISTFENKWGINFEMFQKKLKNNDLGENIYSFDIEQDFWQWEEAETLKQHYIEIKEKWI